MNEVVLCVGSNVCASNVSRALNVLEGVLECVRSSSLYETPPAGSGTRKYVNAVVCGNTCMDLEALNAFLKQYELDAGRDAGARSKGIVPVDIDIVKWNGEVLRQWDYSQNFFKIGYLELAGSLV